MKITIELKSKHSKKIVYKQDIQTQILSLGKLIKSKRLGMMTEGHLICTQSILIDIQKQLPEDPNSAPIQLLLPGMKIDKYALFNEMKYKCKYCDCLKSVIWIKNEELWRCSNCGLVDIQLTRFKINNKEKQ